MATKILKTLVGTDDGKIEKMDTIKHDGGLWLVPMWYDIPDEGLTKPARIIRMDLLPHQEMNFAEANFVLNHPIPRAVLNGQTPPEEAIGLTVVDRPDIAIRGGTGVQ